MRTSFRAFPDLYFPEPDSPHLSVEGDRIAWAWSMEGTMRGHIDPPGFAPTGARFQIDGVDLWTMEGDRISRYRAFYDLNDLVRQLGILPAAGSRAERAIAALQRLQVRLSRR
jgi:predicted ester cyclase